jgi:hypothetical protein
VKLAKGVQNDADTGQTRVKKIQIASRKVTLTAKKFWGEALVSKEAEEDAIIAHAAADRGRAPPLHGATTSRTPSINGDTAAAQDTAAGFYAADDPLKNWDGLRKLALAGAKTDAANAKLTVAMLRGNRKVMGKYGVDPPSSRTSSRSTRTSTCSATRRADAREVRAERDDPHRRARKVDNVPVIVSEAVHVDLNATGVFDNVTTNRTEAITVYRPGFAPAAPRPHGRDPPRALQRVRPGRGQGLRPPRLRAAAAGRDREDRRDHLQRQDLMADIVFNVAKGKVAEKVRDDATKIGVLLLKTVESDALMKDRTTIADLLAGSTEANFTNYARKTAITATLTVDQANDRVDVDIPNQTWAAAGGATNNTLAKAVVFYDEGGTAAPTRPASRSSRSTSFAAHEIEDRLHARPRGSTAGIQFAAAGFYRALQGLVRRRLRHDRNPDDRLDSPLRHE